MLNSSPSLAVISMGLPPNELNRLRCPGCHASLIAGSSALVCVGCGLEFPIVGDIPIVVDDRRSVFSIADFTGRARTFFPPSSRFRNLMLRLLPSISHNMRAQRNLKQFASILLHQSALKARVLVLGGSIEGEGLREVSANGRIELIESDVAFGPRTGIIFDAHDIPYLDNSFDGVIVQAVLEHVVDPQRCVQEIFRVLRPDGIVYAETPFCQQVHGRQYDFTRYTRLGHRRLFRNFEQIAAGVACGPGMAFAWAYQYFLLSFTGSRPIRNLLKVFARFTGFWLKYFDYFLSDRPAGADSASGFFFLGKKSDWVLNDRELLRLYVGGE